MVKKILIFIFLLLKINPVNAMSDVSYIDDEANVFSNEAISEMNNNINKIVSEKNIPIYIKTSNETFRGSVQNHSDNLLRDIVGADNDGILLYINYEMGDLHLTYSGNAIDIIDDDRRDSLLDNVASKARNNPDKMGKDFINETISYINSGAKFGNQRVFVKQITVKDILISIGVGLVTFFFSKSYISSENTPKYSNLVFPLLASTLMNFAYQNDQIINTSRSVRQIPRNYSPTNAMGNSSSKSTVHRSFRGGSFGGGGRKF